jgi:hypothetical protein
MKYGQILKIDLTGIDGIMRVELPHPGRHSKNRSLLEIRQIVDVPTALAR